MVIPLLGSENIETCLVQDIYVEILLMKGEYEEGYKVCKKYEEIKQKRIKENDFVSHSWISDSLHNLCMYYMRTYNYEEAIEVLERCKKIRGEFYNDMEYNNSYTLKSLFLQCELEIHTYDIEKCKRSVDKLLLRTSEIYTQESE